MPLINKSPIVSVVVITYNSSDFVIETLDSIYKQTYKNIELIISDDCSNDETITLCNQWVNEHKNRFIRTEVIESNTNTGVAANCNRGYKASKGVWIKGIAGDDILLPNCIESYINYIESNSDISICVSKAQCFHISSDGTQIYDNIIPTIENQQIYKEDAISQLKILLKGNIIVTPTMFVKKEVFLKHKFNDIYRYMEDIPFLIDVTKNNVKIHSLLKVIRKHSVDNHNILDALFEEYNEIRQEKVLTQIRDYIKQRKTEIEKSFIYIYEKPQNEEL